MTNGTFYIIATPIGNMKDITLRAVEALKSVDIVFAEDTRVAGKLLKHLNISKPIKRADAYTEKTIGEKLINELKDGKNVAFVSDAGTPGVSDPGEALVNYVRQNSPETRIIPIPGASAITAIMSVSGISSSGFVFAGYPPHKKGRKKFFESLKNSSFSTIIFYESPFRISKFFEEIAEYFGKDIKITVGRELTKIHEDIFTGGPEEALTYFVGEKKKGEFTVMIQISK